MTVQEKILSQSAESIPQMLSRRIELTPGRSAFMFPDSDEKWQTYSWNQVGQLSYQVAAALLSLGIELEDRAAIAASTRIEWVLASYGINAAGGAVTTIYPNTTDHDVAYILSDSNSRVVFVEDADQVAKITKHTELDDQIIAIVVFDGSGDGAKVHAWQDFLDAGQKYLTENPDAVVTASAAAKRDSLATLIYTSGTTGNPKGVELTHQSWTYLAVAIDSMALITIDDLQFLWLPLSHVFGNMLVAMQLWIGFASAIDGRVEKIVSNLAVVKPNFMCGAPRIFEKVRSTVLTGESSQGTKGKIARWAFHVGRESIPYRLKGEKLPVVMRAQYAIADRLVFSKLKERLGGNIKFMVSGSAKLSAQVQEWFYAAGILIIEGYGLTETSAAAFINHWSTPRFGTVGTATPGTEPMIADDGEVLLRGPIIMRGYHDQPEATKEALAGGWFHTGDIGELDQDGYLRITDRKKDLIKTSGGKYVAPMKVESAIIANVPYVSQAIVVGDDEKYVAALLVLDPDALARWGAQNGMGDLDYATLSQRPEVHKMIHELMKRANKSLERWETVKKFAILDHELSVDEGTVTPNMKIRRRQVVADNKELVASLFTSDAE